ncbi:MAG: 30S ribosomal protein S16 [Gemmataceae bacterium]
MVPRCRAGYGSNHPRARNPSGRSHSCAETDGAEAHRHYRIVAIDGRQPRDGRVIEEPGTYDLHVKAKESRVTPTPSRIKHWLSAAPCAGNRGGVPQEVPGRRVGEEGGRGRPAPAALKRRREESMAAGARAPARSTAPGLTPPARQRRGFLCASTC